MQYTSELILTLEPSGYIPVVKVKHGDKSTRFLNITIVKNNEKYIPGSELAILFREEKPDGSHVVTDNIITDDELGRELVVLNDDGTITVELTEQMTACIGYCKCDLCFVSGDTIISTSNFIIEVCSSPNVSDDIISRDDFRSLVNALNNVWRSGVIAVPGAVSTGFVEISASWVGSDPYSAPAVASGYTVTEDTTVSIINDADVISQLAADNVSSLYITNTGGTLSAMAVGGRPSKAMRVPVYFMEAATSSYTNLQDGQVIAYDSSSGKWTNRDVGTYGYLTEQDVRNIIATYHYLTESEIETKVEQMIEDYIESLDANNVRY